VAKIVLRTVARIVAVVVARAAAPSAVNVRNVVRVEDLVSPFLLGLGLTIPDHIRVVAAILKAQRTVGAVAIVVAAALLVELALTGLAVEAPIDRRLSVWLALHRSRQLATRIWCSRPTALQ
jgi:hypothetical protein